MAYDVEIQTPRGRIGLNLNYLSSTLMDTVLQGYVQQGDGTWKYMGYVAIGGAVDVSGNPEAILAKMLVQENLATSANADTVRAWLASRSQEAALSTILTWLKKVHREHIVAFINRIIGVVPGQPSDPGPVPTSGSFVSAEHALRTAIKALPYQVNPTTGEVSIPG